MPGIVDLPQVVREATQEFGDLFACAPQRRHFGEYLTGLMIAESLTIFERQKTPHTICCVY